MTRVPYRPFVDAGLTATRHSPSLPSKPHDIPRTSPRSHHHDRHRPTHTVPEKAGNNAADDDDAICQTTSPSQIQFPECQTTCQLVSVRGREPQKVNLRHPKSHVPQHRSYHCRECMQRWDRAVGEDGARWGWRDTVEREMDRSVSQSHQSW